MGRLRHPQRRLVPVPHEGLEGEEVVETRGAYPAFPFPMRGWKEDRRLNRA